MIGCGMPNPDEPTTFADSPEAITGLVERILSRTKMTRELCLETPLPALHVISVLLDEVDALRALVGLPPL
jgi:hypothetical protein